MVKLKLVLSLGALILIGAGCVSVKQSLTEPKGAPPSASGESSGEVVVEMTANGFNPPASSIKAGTTVKFINKDTVPRWPASGMHPTHQVCPGFDSKKSIAPGESYSFTFTEAKNCPMHDHLNPATRGAITVEE